MESLIFLNKLVKKKVKAQIENCSYGYWTKCPLPPPSTSLSSPAYCCKFSTLLSLYSHSYYLANSIPVLAWMKRWRIFKNVGTKKIINTLNLLWRVMVLVLLVCLVLWITSILAFLVNIYVVLTLVLSNKESILLTISITWTGNVNNDYHQESKTYRKSNSFCPIISMYVK